MSDTTSVKIDCSTRDDLQVFKDRKGMTYTGAVRYLLEAAQSATDTENSHYGPAVVYFTDESYTKSEEDFDIDDYAEWGEYVVDKEENTPGTLYPIVSVSPNGWVECGEVTDDGEIRLSETIPSHRIERIRWWKSGKSNSEYQHNPLREMD